MTPPTVPLLTDLRAALEAVDEATRICLVVAWEQDYPNGAQVADDYYRADAEADRLLTAIVDAGGARGLDDALGAAHRRATERLTGCYALRDEPGGPRAVLVAEHAADAALGRLCRAQVVALAWLARKAAA